MAGRLLISAAHTLENPGAIYQDLREADLTRKLLKLCIPHLEKSGITFQAVPLDLPLLQRIEWINATGYTEEQGDIMVELHINDGGKRGIESWYRGAAAPDNKSQKLAESISEHICDKLKYTNLGAKSEYEHELTSLLILNSINSTGVALEVLFIDNSEDIAILKDDKKLEEVAKTIVDGIKNYLDNPDKPTKASQTQQTNTQSDQNNQSLQSQINPNTNIQNNSQSINNNGINPIPLIPPSTPTFSTPQSQAGFPQSSFGGFGSGNPAAQRPFGGGAGNSPFSSSFGGGQGFGGGASSFGGMGGGLGGSKATLMDRDERKKMIKEVYQLILGKDPKPADENYYLNTGATRDELIKKLTESEDFKKMVEDSKKVKDLEDRIQKLESEVNVLKANSSDSESMKESMNKLLEQKNIMINRLYLELVHHGVIQQGEHFESRKKPTEESANSLQISSEEPLGKKIAKLVMKFTKV